MSKEIVIEIKNIGVIFLSIILLVFFIMELQLMFSSPIVFGDEGTHASLGKYIGLEKDFPVWRPMVGTNVEKQGYTISPLWHLLQAGFYLIFGFHDIIIKFIVPFISLLTGIVSFILVKKIYNKEVIAIITSLILVTYPSFVTYSVLVYTDILLVFYLSIFWFTSILAFKTNSKKYLLLSIIFCSLAYLTKNTGFFAYGFLVIIFLYKFFIKKWKPYGFLKKNYILLLILIIISGSWLLRNYYYYKHPFCTLPFFNRFFNGEGCNIVEKYEEKFKFERWAPEVGTEMSVYKMGIMNFLVFAYGNVWLTIFSFTAGIILLFIKRSDIDILLVLSLVLLIPILVYFSPRAENTSRYMLGWAPLIALVSARYFDEMYNFIKKYQKYLALVILVLIIIFGFQSLQEKLNVMKQVKQFSPLFFEACDWIKKNTDKNIRLGNVIWASHTLYNCDRNVGGGGADVVYSNNVTLVLDRLKTQGVTHLFIQKFSISWTDEKVSERHPISFIQFLENNPTHFKKVYENGPSLEQCQTAGGCDGNILYEVVY
jgi:hypothetical protein